MTDEGHLPWTFGPADQAAGRAERSRHNRESQSDLPHIVSRVWEQLAADGRGNLIIKRGQVSTFNNLLRSPGGQSISREKRMALWISSVFCSDSRVILDSR
jgi:hypothetical protein